MDSKLKSPGIILAKKRKYGKGHERKSRIKGKEDAQGSTPNETLERILSA